ncbi:FecR family protein [Sphingosinicella terrae]|uniref:FecR family protein n=1 Tax=Sphingosinicella terrae TaxID=2172047 RepID=UPI000E0D69FF|nr:FecR domain-containing protein [Sphingosinicella terrae]
MVRIGSGNGDEVEGQAAAWAVRSAERELTGEEQRQLDAWLAQSHRHLGAFVRAQALWLDVDRVAALDAAPRPEPVADEAPRRWSRYAMAASLAVALIGGGLAYDRLPGRVATERAEVREIALEDGSRLFLNGGATVQVRYGEDQRRIVVRDGEALFDVAHDSARPFVVTAQGVTVTAIGTRFAVERRHGEVEVTVEEGVVAVDEAGGERRLIRANEQFVMASTGARRATLEASEVGRRLAWQRGLLVFDGQSLGRAAAEVNRYSDVAVTIDDPTLARAEFVGVFRIGDGEAFARGAAQAFNGQVVVREDGLHLMRRSNSPSH